jgi:transposase
LASERDFIAAPLIVPAEETRRKGVAKCRPAAKRLGRPRCVALRAVVEALLYLLRTASPWRLLPRDLPNRSTVQRYFYAWQAAAVWKTINVPLLHQAREPTGREASPSAGVIDSQSVKTTQSGGPRGDDAGKKINGRKRPIITDTVGHLVAAKVHTADIQDRDGAPNRASLGEPECSKNIFSSSRGRPKARPVRVGVHGSAPAL